MKLHRKVLAPFAVDQAADLCSCGHENDDSAARSGEMRLATSDEMDLDAGVWTIPAARMKAKRDHRVPLSGRALAILHDVRRLSNGNGLVFRSPRGKPLSNMTLSKWLYPSFPNGVST